MCREVGLMLTQQAANQKKERAQMDGEERERAELEAQIARARALEGEKKEEDGSLKKKEGEKITLSFGAPVSTSPAAADPTSTSTPAAPSSSSAPAGQSAEAKPPISFGTIGQPTPAPTSISINPLKRPAPVNVFKAAKTAKTESSGDSHASNGAKKGYMSEAERLMKEDQARKSMKAGGNAGYQGAGPRRTGDGGRRFVLQ